MELTDQFGIKALEVAEKAGALQKDNEHLLVDLESLKVSKKYFEILLANLRIVGDDYVSIENPKEVIMIIENYNKQTLQVSHTLREFGKPPKFGEVQEVLMSRGFCTKLWAFIYGFMNALRPLSPEEYREMMNKVQEKCKGFL